MLGCTSNLTLLNHRVDVTGNVCDFNNNNEYVDGYSAAISVANQTDMDAKLDGCTTVIGLIIIGTEYTGSFEITNITNITMGIMTLGTPGPLGPTQDSSTPLLTTFRADSIISMGEYLYLGKVPALESISMANLASVGKFGVDSSPALTMNFPQLKNVSTLQIWGGFSRLNVLIFVSKGRTNEFLV
jgi:hypothetical protein